MKISPIVQTFFNTVINKYNDFEADYVEYFQKDANRFAKKLNIAVGDDFYDRGKFVTIAPYGDVSYPLFIKDGKYVMYKRPGLLHLAKNGQ